jgi:hypothetical protein
MNRIVSFSKGVIHKIKKWRLKVIHNISKKFGFIPVGIYNNDLAECQSSNITISRMYARVDIENTGLKTALAELPFNFDNLLSHYNENSLNALVYHIINDTRNNPDRVDYLERWRLRIISAQNSITKEMKEGREDINM